MKTPLIYAPVFLLFLTFSACMQTQNDAHEEEWTWLFNGTDLTGWTPKFAGHSAGENYKNTFQVQDSMLRVTYAEYDSFHNEFGHLFYKTPFSAYRLKLDYRFTGDAIPGAPTWAYRNNGIMIHAQSVQSMLVEQSFPMSVEVQLLGGDTTGERPTGSVCTPGLHVYMHDTLTTEHCISSSSPTYRGDQWVSIEVVVLPDGTFHHIVQGDTVMTCET